MKKGMVIKIIELINKGIKMKTFLGVLGVFSLLGALGTFINGIYIWFNAGSILDQGASMQFLTYSGILLIAGIVGMGFSLDTTEVANTVESKKETTKESTKSKGAGTKEW